MVQMWSATGLTDTAFGVRNSANMFNDGEHYDRFYVVPQEVMAAEWLSRHQAPGDLVYADPYGQLRLHGYGSTQGITLLSDVTPATVDVNGWVYATRVNDDGLASAYYGPNSVTYRFPSEFLESQLGVAYSNGTSEVFHR